MKTKIAQPVPELPVKDVEQAQMFYRDKLGFDIAWTYPDKVIGAVSRGDVVIFFRKQDEVFPSTHWIFADDVDTTYNEVLKSGITIIEGIENKPWGIRQFTVADADGHRFIFHHEL